MSSDLSPSLHVNEIVAKGHKRAALIYRAFVSRDINIRLRAYLVYVRPLLEFNSIIWSPYTIKDITSIESVQRRFTKRLPGFNTLCYRDRLKPKFHYTDPTRLCRRPGSTTRSPTKFGWVRSGLRQVGGLCLVVDLSAQSRHVRILSVGLVGSQTKSVGPCSGIQKRHDRTRPATVFFRIFKLHNYDLNNPSTAKIIK